MSTPRDEGRDEGTDAAEPREPDRDELAPTAVLDDVRPTEVIQPLGAERGEDGASVETGTGRPRRRVKPWAIALVSVVAVGALLVVADLVTRSALEQRIVDEVEANLPEGVEGEVSAHLGGFSVLAQLVTGSFEEVTLDVPGLEVRGNPLDAHVVAAGVPLQEGAPIDRVTGTVDIDEASLNQLVEIPGADGEISLGEGTLGYGTTFQVLGFDLSAAVTASAEAAGTSVLLTPVGVEVSAGGNDLDLSGLAQQVLGDEQVEVCVAEYLPAGLLVEDIALTDGHARVAFTATDIPFEEASLRTTGTCDGS
ncbi:LmeA family phospholipid-binding protein [Agromyces salentinus]|uniref:DUF2993 domain-containing protein n=1 Tax=Agromyces salentinus TaxID=269421 RepID=A0ABN2MZ96_9MICO|nr:DUF2993 domain-containing protein [Agromyces salentinus]